MKIPHSYSQAKQDQFVFEMLVKGPNSQGRFLDVGCSYPVEINNTYALEQLGWTGVMIDSDPVAITDCRLQRKAQIIEANSLEFNWNELPGKVFDYLSLDVDDATAGTLDRMLKHGVEFRVATIEHDFYRLGDGPRKAMRDMMQVAGYTLLLGDIASTPGMPYEDWWVHRSIKNIMFDLTPYLTKDTTILPAVPCKPCGAKR